MTVTCDQCGNSLANNTNLARHKKENCRAIKQKKLIKRIVAPKQDIYYCPSCDFSNESKKIVQLKQARL